MVGQLLAVWEKVLEVGRHTDEVKEKGRRNREVSVSLLYANSFEHSKLSYGICTISELIHV